MRIAYLDCFSGISGDMFLGALVDAGVPSALLKETVDALNVGARMEVSRVDRAGISATKVDVYSCGEKDLPREQYWENRARRDHASAHNHEPVQLLEHNYAVQEAAPHEHQHRRGLKEIREIIAKAAISDSAKSAATCIFAALGEAEAKIH